MLTWNIDASQLLDRLNMDSARDALRSVAGEAGELIAAAWREGANGRVYPGMSRPLHSDTYQSLIQVGRVVELPNGAMVSVYAVPTRGFDLVAAIEEGQQPRDMKPGLLRSDKAKTSKDGARYLVIPFRHGTGESVHFVTNISPDANRIATTMGSLTRKTYAMAARGGSYIPFGGPLRVVNPWLSAAKVAAVLGPKHRLPPRYLPQMHKDHEWQRRMYEGLRKVPTSSGGSQAMTFRTVSSHSPSDSWRYPAVPPNRIFDSMARAIEPEVRDLVEQAIRGAVGAT